MNNGWGSAWQITIMPVLPRAPGPKIQQQPLSPHTADVADSAPGAGNREAASEGRMGQIHVAIWKPEAF